MVKQQLSTSKSGRTGINGQEGSAVDFLELERVYLLLLKKVASMTKHKILISTVNIGPCEDVDCTGSAITGLQEMYRVLLRQR